MSSSLDKTVDLRQYARLLWRRRSVVILASFAVIASSMIALSLKPSEYRSEVTLMVEDRKRLTREVEQVMGGTGPTERRYLPRAMGRATRVNKKSTHLHVVLSDVMEKKAKK